MLTFLPERALSFNELGYTVFGKTEILFQNGSYAFDGDLGTLICNFVNECKGKQAGSDFVLQNLVNLIAMYIIRKVDNNMPDESRNKHHGMKNMERVIEYLKQQSCAEFSLGDAAKEADLSLYHFIRIFKLHTGKTPYGYFCRL